MTSSDEHEQLHQHIQHLEARLEEERSARADAETRLRTSEERYRSIVETTPSGICITNQETLYEYVNPAYCHLYGYDREELIGKSFTIVVPEENRDFMIDLHDQYIQGATEVQGEWNVVDRTGNVRTILADAARIIGNDGRPKKATFVVDITDRKHAEEAIQRQNAYLNALHEVTLGLLNRLGVNDVLKAAVTQAGALVGTMHGFVYLIEPDGKTMQLRLGTGLLTEVTDHRVAQGIGVAGVVWQTGRSLVIDDYRTWNGRPAEFSETRLRAVVGVPLTSSRKVIGVIGLAYTDDDRKFETSELSILERFAQLASVALDNARLYEAVQRELEERIRTEEKLRVAQQEAEAANQAKSMFLSRMSHELRTPLNAILGFVQVLERDTGLNQKQHERLGIIKRSGNHLLELINNVLEISKIEAGRETLHEHAFDLHACLSGVEELFQIRAQQRGLYLRFDRTASVPKHVYGDEGKLRQVLMNLISNAIKFTDHGEITVRIRVANEQTPASPPTDGTAPPTVVLMFEVQDTGQGIAQDELPVVFESFGQSQSGRQSQEGTGLGLPISRAFVHMMGGDIQVQSTPGAGTTFLFDVHLTRVDATDVADSTPTRRVIGLVADQQTYRILVVDDRWENRSALLELLESVGFVVREANNGQEALDVWEAWEPDCVWMDMHMPVMDGYEATRRMKATPRGQRTPVIALTASAFEHERPTMLAAGCDAIITKPFSDDVIFQTMANHMGVRFVYEGTDDVSVSASSPSRDQQRTDAAVNPLSVEVLAQLPADVLADLEQVSRTLNIGKASGVIERVRLLNSALADALADTVKGYRFDIILSMLEQVKTQ